MVLLVCDLDALCAFVLVIYFASFFGPLVLPYFPLMEVAHRHWTQRISEETVIWKLSSAIWNFQQTVLYRECRA